MNPAIPKLKGTYILWLQLVNPTRIQVGQLGVFAFESGWYAYVGSAFGSGGLRGRLKHHIGDIKRPHWHIDYVRATAQVQEIWYVVDKRCEHKLAQSIHKMNGASKPAAGLGSSDCDCHTHLFHFDEIIDRNIMIKQLDMSLQTLSVR